MEVKRVVHHGAVDEDEPDDFTFVDEDIILRRECLVVKRPDVAIHIPIEREANFSNGTCRREGGVMCAFEIFVGWIGSDDGGFAAFCKLGKAGGIFTEEAVIPFTWVVGGFHVSHVFFGF